MEVSESDFFPHNALQHEAQISYLFSTVTLAFIIPYHMTVMQCYQMVLEGIFTLILDRFTALAACNYSISSKNISRFL